MCCPSVAHIVDLNIGTSCDHHPDIREGNVLAPVVCLTSSVVHISIGTVSQTSLTQVPSQSDAGSFATGHGCHGCLLRCHSLALTGRACHTPSSSWYPYLSVCICICCECNDSEQAFAFACLLGGGLGASRRKRDLIYENMVTDDPFLFPVHAHDIEDYNTIMSHTRVSR